MRHAVSVLALSAGLLAALCAVSHSRGAPRVSSPDAAEEDPDYTQNPAQDDLISQTLHFQNLISEDQAREKNVSGSLDYFIDHLQRGIRATGNDVPRNNILQNAGRARDDLKDAYTDLKDGLKKLLETRDAVKEMMKDVLVPVAKKNEENMQQLRDAAGGAQAEGGGQYGGSGGDVESQADKLDPLPDRLKELYQKVLESKGYIDLAKERVDKVENYRQKAAEYDKAAYERLAQSRTLGGRKGEVPTDLSSEKVIKNANEWLKGTSEKALKLQETMEKLTEPEKGTLGKLIVDAQKADGLIMAARDSAQGGGDSQQSGEAAKSAEGPCKKTSAGVKQLKETMKKLDKTLGDRPKDDLTDLGDVVIDVPAPREPGTAGCRGKCGGKQRSKPIPPDVRAVGGISADTVRGMFGEPTVK